MQTTTLVGYKPRFETVHDAVLIERSAAFHNQQTKSRRKQEPLPKTKAASGPRSALSVINDSRRAMVAVAPLDPASDFVDLPTEVSRKSSVCAWATKLFSVWKRLQLSYFGGKYSIHRAIALDEYIRNTSLLRVVVVCVGTPLPMIVLVFTQESIPLQDPNDGWRVNYGMWIRACILVCVVIQALVLQATYIIEGFTISAWQLFLLCVAVSGGVVALAMLVADYLVFPIPFFILSMLPPFYLMLFASFRLILGRAIISHLLSKRDQVGKFAIIIAAQTIPAIIYPVYEVLFRRTEGTRSQLPVILLLPVIKVAMKNIVLRCLADMEDMAPETVIFTVDYFNAIYIATCMQSASSIAAISNITLTDFVQTAIMVYGLQRRTSDSIPTLHKVVNPAIASDSLLAILCWLCRNPQGLEKHLCDGIHQRSCLPHRISEDGQRVLNRLKTIPSITKGPHSQSIHAVIIGHGDKAKGQRSTQGPGDPLLDGMSRRNCVLRNDRSLLLLQLHAHDGSPQ
ncbi:hypothetical protein ON010_g33 [Phytophthora cinnamomi]|nr:hypothetical protein ON010_g33 [Phytophthora cinnamomi]